MSARLRAFLAGLEDPAKQARPRNPLQRPTWYFPGLASRPWHEPRAFPWTTTLQAAAREIRAELVALRSARSAEVHPAQTQLVTEGEWRAHPIYARGQRFEEVHGRCPTTARLVDAIPGATSAGLVYFSALAPGTRVAPHCGPTNTRLRCHLALIAPTGCTLRVGDERRTWKEGRCLVFDDSFEHEAENPTEAWRVVLVVDVWHPELTAPERFGVDRAFARQVAPRREASSPARPRLAAVGALAAFAARDELATPISSTVTRMARAEPSRCGWAGTNPTYVGYHDTEWGVPVHDDRLLFEFLVLEGAQAGLSWITILRKRAGYRSAFDGFDPAKVARYGEKKIAALLADAGIVRNRMKIESAVKNARAFLRIQEEHGSFDAYQWRFVDGRPRQNRWKTLKDIPPRTDLSDAVSKDLKQRGFGFVGSTIVYSHMQAVGMVNDHLVGCFRHREVARL